MNAKELYTKQMNDFCEENCKLTATDILAKAGNYTSENRAKPLSSSATDEIPQNDIVPITTGRKILRFGNIAAACLICLFLASTTTLATTGHLGSIINNVMNDKKTSEIAQKGYVYELQKTLTDNTFSATLVGFTGDRTNPKVIFDLIIEDPQLIENTENVRIKVYTLGVQQFEQELDHYGYCEANGIKDDVVDNLYHFSVDGASVWLAYGEEAVVQLFEITTYNRSGSEQVHPVNFEYQVTIPEDSFHPVPYIDYSNKGFIYDDVVYSLNVVQYGYYYTQVSFYSDTIAENLPADNSAINTAYMRMERTWTQIASSATLVVDGTEYNILEEDGYSGVWMDSEDEAGAQYRCYMHLFFPDIKYSSAKEIILKIGNTKVIIK